MAKGTDFTKPITPRRITRAVLKKLCEMQCTMEEICYFYDLSEDEIKKFLKKHYKMNWSAFRNKYAAAGKISLRRAQWNKAVGEADNTTMQIWLGRQYLGQKSNDTTEDIEQSLAQMKALLKMMSDQLPD